MYLMPTYKQYTKKGNSILRVLALVLCLCFLLAAGLGTVHEVVHMAYCHKGPAACGLCLAIYQVKAALQLGVMLVCALLCMLLWRRCSARNSRPIFVGNQTLYRSKTQLNC